MNFLKMKQLFGKKVPRDKIRQKITKTGDIYCSNIVKESSLCSEH